MLKFSLRSPNIPKFFVWVSSILGLLYIVFTPPFQSPDEVNHFYRAWHISQGNLYGEKTSDNRIGGYLPKGVIDFCDHFNPFIHCDSCKLDKTLWMQGMQIDYQLNDKDFNDFANTGMYFPVNYIPQVSGIWFGRIFSDSVGFSFYLGRIFNLAFWVALGYLTLSILPVFRELFLFLLLLPSSLAFHTSLNQDVFVHALGFLLMGFFLRTLFEDNRWRLYYAIIIVVFSSILTAMKPTYWPFILFIFFYPIAIGKLSKWVIWPILLIPSLLVLWITKDVSSELFIPFDEYNPGFRERQTLNPGVNPNGQLSYMINEPLKTVKVFIQSYFASLPSTFAHYLGKAGWKALYLPGPLVMLLFLGLIWSSQINRYNWNLKDKFLLLSIIALLIGFFSATMYMLWCPVGYDELRNLQGRYFILIFPLVWLLMPQCCRKLRFESYFGYWLLFSVICNFYLLALITSRFWLF